MSAEVIAEKVVDVKRDMELIRTILLSIQAREDLDLKPVVIDGYDELVVGRHIEMLGNEGFLEGVKASAYKDKYDFWLVKDLSWNGHEFIGAIGPDDLWQKLKEELGPSKLTTMSLRAIMDAGIAGAAAYIKSIF
jgi:hypothetical protein